MKTRRLTVHALAGLFLLPLAALAQQDQTSENNDRLRQFLQRSPGADADKDGVLTLQEAQAFNRRRQQAGRQQQPRPEPTHADVAYGDNEKQRFDLWLAESEEPTPLILFIHGGGFSGGDKRGVRVDVLKQALEAGISYASLNYRLTPEITSPVPYMDCARALQTIRHRAGEWNIDPERIASTGGSAGAGISLWLAFHDDMADPEAEDPIAQQSTRLICAATSAGQCSYDPFYCEEEIGIPRLMEHAFFYAFYGIEEGEEETEEARRRFTEAAPITYLTEDDPPVLMEYGQPKDPITDETPLGAVVHHPLFGLHLQEKMGELGLRCEVRHRDQEGVEPLSVLDFVKGYLVPEG